MREVVVVGAGPAGALAAREIARMGRDVLLLDRSDFPRRKVCGCCLGQGALEVLDSVGLGGLPEDLGAAPLRVFVPTARGRAARLRLPGGCVLSRAVLDEALVDAARREGVEVRTGVAAALGPVAGDRRVVRVGRGKGASEVRARVVLDATGLGGGLSDAGVGRPPPIVAPRSRIGMGATFDAPEYPLAPGELHMAIGRAGYVGLVRNETGRLHVAAAVDPQAVRDSASPDALVAAILAEAGLPPLSGGAVAVWRGTPRLTRAPSSVEAERVLRLGDAAGYVEPFTGEGMCWAMSGAVAAAPLALEAVDRWRPGLSRAWSGYHRRALRGAKLLCRAVVPALRHPRVVEAVLAVLGPAPSLAGPFMRRAARRPSLSVVY